MTNGFVKSIQGVFLKAPFFFDCALSNMEPFKSLLLPATCPICRRALASNAEWPLCFDCLDQIEYLSFRLCEKCQCPISSGTLCKHCLEGVDLGIDFPIRSLARHSGVVRELILACKFKGREDLSFSLGKPLKNIAEPFLEPDEKCFVVPVPLHDKKLIARGFNLPDQMSRKLAKMLGGKYKPFWLKRVLNTESQVGKSFESRLSNVENAFVCTAPEKVKGQKIFLVDDVCTSGATLSAAARPLINAGAEVVGLTLTRA